MAAATRQDNGSFSCPDKGTMSDVLGPFYIENAPETIIIAPLEQLSVPSNVLYVEGTVYGDDCVPMSNIRVEPWYAGGREGGYSLEDSDLEWRGVLYTNECGRYNYTQSFPELYGGRPLHVHFRVSDTESNQEYLVTQMYFEGYDSDVSPIRNLQIVPITTLTDGSQSVAFDIYLSNIKGTADTSTCDFFKELEDGSTFSGSPLTPTASTTITETQTPTATMKWISTTVPTRALTEETNSASTRPSNFPPAERPLSSGDGVDVISFKPSMLWTQSLATVCLSLAFL